MAVYGRTTAVPITTPTPPYSKADYLTIRIDAPGDENTWTAAQTKAWKEATAACDALANALATKPEFEGNREVYDRGYAEGYSSGVRDAQIELRDALKDLQGARDMSIAGYDDDEDADGYS